MKSTIICFIFLINLISSTFATNDSPFVRYPDLNSDGTKIVFSYQGDLWIINSEGGKAERITIHEAYDGWPQWSPDDKSIAFSSNRYGNNDLFTIPSVGGIPSRITFHSANDILNDFTGDQDLLFTTARTFKHVEWDHELASVSAGGGTPTLLLDAVGEMPVKSPDGRFIAFVRGWGRVVREAYRGAANNELWIFDTQNKTYHQLTDFDGHDNYPRWADSRALYYISSQSETYNIHKLTIDDNANVVGDIEQITNYSDDGVRFFNISGDGKAAVYERQTDIYTLNLSNGISSKVNTIISADNRFDPIEHKTFSDKMNNYEVSPNGKYTAINIRGEIFLIENDKEKKQTINLTKNAYRDQNPTWLSDTNLILISDREGQQDIYLIRSSNKGESNIFKSLRHEIVKLTNTPEDESLPIVSPDGKKIVYQIGRGKLVLADIDKAGKLTNFNTLLDGWSQPGDVKWSPDSKWIAYSLEDLYFNREIFIHPIDNHIAPINVSMHPRNDSNPIWSTDGTKLGFISSRNSYNMLEKNNNDIWFVWLNKEDWDRTKDDWDEYEKPDVGKKDKEQKDENDKKVVKHIKIDIENIFERLVQVTSLSGNENNIQFSDDGEKIFFTTKSPTKKGKDLFSIKWNGKDTKNLTNDGGNPERVKLSSDGKYLFFDQKGKLNRYDLGKDKKESLPFSAKMKINFPLEKDQKFEEGWRALRDGFYDPNYHGQNWTDLKSKYKPWCLAASTDKDFQDMYTFLLGELNASHMGMRGMKPREDLQKEKTGFLGIRVESADKGVEIVNVIKSSPADKENSKLQVGDIITSINGGSLSGNTNFYSLLSNTADEKVLLDIIRNGKNEEIIIRPTSSLKNLLYDEWVGNNRKLVDKFSGGKLGYLHIEAMGWKSFERFEREFTARAYNKEGIVIDVRYNGGGWTTDFLMTILNYKQHAYTIPRGAANNLLTEKVNFRDYYPLGERLPFSAWTKSSIALCNQNSYSNAEIFSHAFKNLGIGKLVGVPTFGAVISTGAKMLIDGSYVRMPFRGWFVKADNTNMDFVPAVPDIIVENAPNAKATGNDAQLKRAVDELLLDLQ